MRRGLRAFTLVEVLIALSIFTVVAAAVYAALQSGISGYARIDSAQSPVRKAGIIFNRLERDFNRCVPQKAKVSGFQGDERSFSFFTVSDSYQEAGVQSRYCLVEYAWEGESLIKRSACNAAALGKDPQWEAGVAVKGIEGMSVSYQYATGNADAPYAWGMQWPSPEEGLRQKQMQLLPLAVKVSLKVSQYDVKRRKTAPAHFEKVFSLPLARDTVDE
jgi:prepilin-type N-terminal cleavage/methylation domain-containing protein